MEGEVVRRRINMIAAHFSPNDETSATHLLPMNCSGSLNSVLRRHDNRMYFARQGSDSLGFFMRQASEEEVNATSHVAPKSSCVASESRAPCFAKPAGKESDFLNAMAQISSFVASDPPTFSRPGKQSERGYQLPSEKKMHNSEVASCQLLCSRYCQPLDGAKIAVQSIIVSHPTVDTATAQQLTIKNPGIEWSPRMDVAESEGKFVLTVEVPGVRNTDIRVEVDDQKLSVKGRRSTSYRRVADSPNASFSLYHKREILYGPYEVVWPLPTRVNKDGISAEFLDGFLQIIIPKY